jgi:hypothetical protein
MMMGAKRKFWSVLEKKTSLDAAAAKKTIKKIERF